MAINFPTGLDDFTDYVDGTTVMIASTLNNMQLGIEALEAKVGIDASAVVTSHDYKIAQLEGGDLVASGATVFNTTMAVASTLENLDISAQVGSNVARCLFEVKIAGACQYVIAPLGYGATYADTLGASFLSPNTVNNARNPGYYYFYMDTNSSGVLQHGCALNSITITIKLINYSI